MMGLSLLLLLDMESRDYSTYRYSFLQKVLVHSIEQYDHYTKNLSITFTLY
jgi:hypothetical protein